MYVEVLNPGLATSIQDKGRLGYAKYGIPVSGTMDRYSATFANALVQNREEDALMEITLLGPRLYFPSPTKIAVSGLSAQIFLNSVPIPLNQAIFVPEKSILEIKRVTKGRYVYLAVAGGFHSEKALKSRSQYKNISKHSFLGKKDRIPLKPYEDNFFTDNSNTKVRYAFEKYGDMHIEVMPGPEFKYLTKKGQQTLLNSSFTISPDSNRMAYIFEERIIAKTKPILTSPVLPGTVQLTPGGKLITLMRDAQVTGGYPRVLQIHSDSINALAQKKAHEEVRFMSTI